MTKRKQKTYKRNPSKTNSKTDSEFEIPQDFKIKLLGLLMIIIGILLTIAIFAYSASDTQTLMRFSLFDIFRKETYSSIYKINNPLGVVGAYTAYIAVENIFGYFTFIISVVISIIGFAIYKKNYLKPVTFSVYLLTLMVLLATSAGIIRSIAGPESFSGTYSGAAGNFLSSIFYAILGGIGSGFLFFVLILFNILLFFDGNVLKTLARIKLFWEKVKEKFAKEKATLKQSSSSKQVSTDTIQNKNIKNNNEETSLSEDIKKELERIRSLKNNETDASVYAEKELIKETGINRPKEKVSIPLQNDNENQIPLEDELSTVPPKKQKDNKKKKILSELLIDEPLLTDASEVDINPANSNELDEMKNKQEDDFKEETLNDYKNPSLDLLENPSKEEDELISDEELKNNGRLLQEKLLKFGIKIIDIQATPGPVVTLYELVPAPEVKLSKIESLQDDIALAMKARGIRMIIPIPGKGTVGVEIPNSKSQMVRVKSVVSSSKFTESTKRLSVAFGKMIDGEIFVDDLAKMPHVLIAGATGSGKSVGINTIIASLLYKMHPADLKFVMIDPKKIELSLYSKLRHHFVATSNDINESIVTSPSNAVSILKSVEMEMEQRYDKLANAGVRNIESYNAKYAEGKLKNNEAIRHRKMPYIVVIIDELADLMITAKKEIEDPIARIAQMARAVGIHLIVATQRPSVDVITGVIKANFPVRVAYQVASKIDSRTILDMAGADQLLRNGDMLYLSASSPKPIRIQNAYISTEECEKLVDYISAQKGFSKPYLLPSIINKKRMGTSVDDDWDEMFPDAARLILKLQNCSTSTLQRRLKLGYARAARIVDQMEEAGIVGPNQGAKGREILITEEELEEILEGL